jgi:O-methyltransferase
MTLNFDQIYKKTAPFTMTSRAKMEKLHQAVLNINQNNIEGSFVECGVFKGGSVMNMALTQLNFKRTVHIYLYDTFEGMTPYTKHDINYRGVSAERILKNPNKKCICSLEDVQKNLTLTDYPKEFLHFRKGDVAVTLKQDVPKKIALLRLDTDWYESTKISLEILYPKLVRGGVLIMDDYGYWKGARKAADDYFSSIGIKPNFKPLESGISGVIFIKS